MSTFAAIESSSFLLMTFYLTSLNASKHDSEPRNSAVIVGNPMVMTCRSTSENDKIHWTFRNPNIVGEDKLHDGSGKFSVITDKSTDTNILTKNETSFSDSGIYTCNVKRDNKSILHSAELIVVDPVCKSSIGNNTFSVNEGTLVELCCNISYFGNADPVLMWFRGNEKLIPQNIHMNTNSTFRQQKLTLKLNASDNGIVFSFLLYFGPPRSYNTTQEDIVVRAKNAPEFEFRWNFIASVYYGPRNIWIENLKDSYDHGDTVICRAEGNPPLNYKWISTANGEVTEGGRLTIPKTLKVNTNHPYECLVVNSVSGANDSKTIIINVFESIQPTLLLSVLLPIIGFLLILMFVMIIQKRYSIGLRDSVEWNPADEQSPATEVQTAPSSLPKDAVRSSSDRTMPVNVVHDEAERVIQMESTAPYSELTVTDSVRQLSVAPIYAQLEYENTSSTVSRNDHYVNFGDIRVAGTMDMS